MSKQDTQGLDLITLIFNSYSAKGFVSQLCPRHPDQYLSLVCHNCVAQTK